MRDARRLLDELDWVDASPGGAGCVNGTRLLEDRGPIAGALGFGGVIPHTRDAMWQVDGLIHILATAASLLSNFSKLAEDLEIFASSRVRLRRPRRRLHPLVDPHAEQAQPVRARDRPRRLGGR